MTGLQAKCLNEGAMLNLVAAKWRAGVVPMYRDKR